MIRAIGTITAIHQVSYSCNDCENRLEAFCLFLRDRRLRLCLSCKCSKALDHNRNPRKITLTRLLLTTCLRKTSQRGSVRALSATPVFSCVSCTNLPFGKLSIMCTRLLGSNSRMKNTLSYPSCMLRWPLGASSQRMSRAL